MTTEGFCRSKRADILERLTTHLLDRHGPVIGADHLWEIMSFKSRQAFDRSVQRKRTVLPFFRQEGRDGLFVLAPVLAEHLVNLSEIASIEKGNAELETG